MVRGLLPARRAGQTATTIQQFLAARDGHRLTVQPADVIAFVRQSGAEVVDLKFADLVGTLQHLTIPAEALDDEAFAVGIGFDGSSIRGFQEIAESDMLLRPDPTTAVLDRVDDILAVSLFCDIYDPVTGERFTRDSRYIAQKAEAFLRQSGIADVSYWGPEIEFFILDDARFDQTSHSGYYFLDSREGAWNSGRDEQPNLAYKPRFKEGYFPAPPTDSLHRLRTLIVRRLRQMGIAVEAHHHEVATGGQCEIDLRYQSLTRMADQVLLYKYVVKTVARENGKTATFMPKPIFGDNGSGMHTHQSLWKEGQNLFYDPEGYAQLSPLALYYIGGLLRHAPALLALCAPTTNSYRRLVPGYEAPVNLIYSQRNRSACVRIPMYSTSPQAKRIEFRCPDPSCNPYLAFAAMLMAGLDGIINRIEPPPPIDKDLYELEPEEAMHIKSTPGSLAETLAALEDDHAFLLRGDVFTPDVIETWIDYKRKRELQPVALRPHPYEFYLYFDI